MKPKRVGKYHFMAEPFHVDFTGKLMLGVLGNHLLNCAGIHATDRGLGIGILNEQHHTWVLSRLAIELEEMPAQYENFTIETWIENVYRFFTDRNFAIVNEEGKAIGYARSVWAMIDVDSRKPADLIALHGEEMKYYVVERDCPIQKPGKIKLSSTEPVAVYKTRYSDIDVNGHVNSIKYMEHLLDLFPLDWYQKKQIKRFEMAYVAESYYGDTLSYYREEVSENEYNLEVKKNDTEVVVRGKVIFNS